MEKTKFYWMKYVNFNRKSSISSFISGIKIGTVFLICHWRCINTPKKLYHHSLPALVSTSEDQTFTFKQPAVSDDFWKESWLLIFFKFHPFSWRIFVHLTQAWLETVYAFSCIWSNHFYFIYFCFVSHVS